MSARPARPLALAALLASAALVACDGAERALAPQDPLHALRVEPAVLAAVADAEARLLPALDPAVRPAVGGALAELHAALDAGQVRRTAAALAALRRLADEGAAPPSALADHADGAAPTASAAPVHSADLGAVAVLVGAVEQAVTPPAAP